VAKSIKIFKRKIIIGSLIVLLGFCFTGCITPPQKGGSASFFSGKETQQLQQSENPFGSSSQNFDKSIESSLKITPGSTVTTFDLTGSNKTTEIKLSGDSELHTKETIKTGTIVGAAQKDVAREIGAKLKSLSVLVYVGIFLFIGGIATLFVPYLKILIGSTTASIGFIVGGILLMALPSLIVGNELLIGGVVLGALGIYFFAHRYASHATKATIYKEFIDSNKDKIDDNLQLLMNKMKTAKNEEEIQLLIEQAKNYKDGTVAILVAARQRREELSK